MLGNGKTFKNINIRKTLKKYLKNNLNWIVKVNSYIKFFFFFFCFFHSVRIYIYQGNLKRVKSNGSTFNQGSHSSHAHLFGIMEVLATSKWFKGGFSYPHLAKQLSMVIRVVQSSHAKDGGGLATTCLA